LVLKFHRKLAPMWESQLDLELGVMLDRLLGTK
jgi:hypothetical protein